MTPTTTTRAAGPPAIDLAAVAFQLLVATHRKTILWQRTILLGVYRCRPAHGAAEISPHGIALFSPDGRLLAAADSADLAAPDGGTVLVLRELHRMAEVSALGLDPLAAEDGLAAAAAELLREIAGRAEG